MFKKILLVFFVLLVASGLAFTQVVTFQHTLNWTDNSDNEVEFKLERALCAPSTFAEVAVIPANTTSYTDTTVPDIGTYCYRVKAVNAADDSVWSNIGCKSIVPPSGPDDAVDISTGP